MEINNEELLSIAEKVLATNKYLTLATTALNGVPWAAPLMYSMDKDDRFYWVSAADAIHSIHVRENPRVAFVIFDSNPGYGNAQALYCAAEAEELSGSDLEFGCEVFYRMRYPDPAIRQEKGRVAKDFEGESPRRMYRAKVTEYSILHPNKHPVFGSLIDFRAPIPFSTIRVGIV